MALIYLRHPLHGEKAESNDLITYLDLKAGWVAFDPVQEAADRAAQPARIVGAIATSEVEITEDEKPKKKKAAQPDTAVPDFLKN